MNGKWSSILCVFVLFFVSLPAEAHQIKTDGSMSVMLHSDPNDDPYAGEPAILYFTFTDKDKKFRMEACDCRAYVAPYDQLPEIKDKGFLQALDSSDIARVYGSYSFEYVFPRRDLYAVVVEGNPREEALFAPFRIIFDLRIAKGEDLTVPPPDSFFDSSFFLMAALTTLLLIFLISVGILIQRHVFKK